MFYENFLNLCLKVGKSPSSVVTEVGINKSAVTNWKKGRNPTNSNISKLADYFGISVKELVGTTLSVSDSDTKQAAAPKDSSLVDEFTRLFSELTPENQNMVIAEMLKRRRES